MVAEKEVIARYPKDQLLPSTIERKCVCGGTLVRDHDLVGVLVVGQGLIEVIPSW